MLEIYKKLTDRQVEWVRAENKNINFKDEKNIPNMTNNDLFKKGKLCGSEEQIVLNNFNNLTPEIIEEYKIRRNKYVECINKAKIDLI